MNSDLLYSMMGLEAYLYFSVMTGWSMMSSLIADLFNLLLLTRNILNPVL